MAALPALPTLLPLPEAARKYGLDEAHLRSPVESGNIKAAMVMDNVVVDEGEVAKTILRKEDLPEYKKFAHLAGQSIWLSEASRLYNTKHAFKDHV